jgi:hypothetical protein
MTILPREADDTKRQVLGLLFRVSAGSHDNAGVVEALLAVDDEPDSWWRRRESNPILPLLRNGGDTRLSWSTR